MDLPPAPEAALHDTLNAIALPQDLHTPVRAGLDAALSALAAETDLSAQGQARAQAHIADNLCRLGEIFRTRTANPEIADVPVIRPVFILGLPRCGTSLLHAMIGADSAVRTPLSWEVASPSPPPQAATFATDPRAAAFDAYVDAAFQGEWADVRKAHPIGARIPQECGMILETAFQSINFSMLYRVPPYYRWYLGANSTAAYRIHKMWLQHLAWRNPRARWVLKVQEHAYHLPRIAERVSRRAIRAATPRSGHRHGFHLPTDRGDPRHRLSPPEPRRAGQGAAAPLARRPDKAHGNPQRPARSPVSGPALHRYRPARPSMRCATFTPLPRSISPAVRRQILQPGSPKTLPISTAATPTRSPITASPRNACATFTPTTSRPTRTTLHELAPPPPVTPHPSHRTVPLTQIAEGLALPEGPVALPNGELLVVEVMAGRLTRISPDGAKTLVAATGGGPNGAALGPDGSCIVCNNGGTGPARAPGVFLPSEAPHDTPPGSIQTVDLATGAVATLYSHAESTPFWGPNDLVCDADHGFWFTDFGRDRGAIRQRGGVYYARTDGSAITQALFPLESPNGIGLSPDGATLYVAETYTGHLWAYPIAAPGVLQGAGQGARIVGRAGPGNFLDSLAVDSAGNICVASPGQGAILVFPAAGGVPESFPMPDFLTTNIAFGGSDLATAYITLGSTGRLVSMPWPRPGLRLNNR